MKLLRFTRKSYVNGRIVEPGDEVLMPDNFPMAAHIVDVRAESEAHARGEELPEPVFPRSPETVFRTDLAYDLTSSGGVPVFPTLESQKAFDEMTIGAKAQAEHRKAQTTDLLSAPDASPAPPPFKMVVPQESDPPTIDAEPVDAHPGFTPAPPLPEPPVTPAPPPADGTS